MKALILSCGTGGGHNAAGAAVKAELERRGHTVRMLNPYELKSSKSANRMNQVYIKTVQKMPRVFGVIYNLGNAYRRLPFRSPVYFFNAGMVKRLAALFEREKPDVVIMPHLYPAEIITNMKNRGLALPKTVFVATDYTCIPFTEETDCDAYVIPSKRLTGEYTARKIPQEKLYPLGIPVDRRFSSPEPREDAVERLCLDCTKRYILISGGSMGAGRLVFAIKILYDRFKGDENTRLIVICGSNELLYKQLTRFHNERIIPVRYTNQMADYMRVSDMYITKPGGLSSTEGAVMGVPMVHTMSIPGCENANMRFFGELGMSIPVKKLRKSLSAAAGQLENSDVVTQMRQNQKDNINPAAAEEICALAERLVSGGKEAAYIR